jgi:hypothetical protein
MTSRAELLTPEEELKRKAAAFEVSVANFEAERQRLSDLLAIDCKRLSRELDAETDRVWAVARGELRQIVAEGSAERGSARERVTAALSRYFEQALRDCVGLLRTRLDERVSVHRDRALVNLVRQTAADLMQIPVNLPHPEEAFQPRREPYWVAPASAVSLLDLSAGAAARLLPRTLRDRRARSSRRGGREGRAAQRRQPRLGVAPEHRGFVSSLRDFAVRTTGSGAAGHPSGAAIGAAAPRRSLNAVALDKSREAPVSDDNNRERRECERPRDLCDSETDSPRAAHGPA